VARTPIQRLLITGATAALAGCAGDLSTLEPRGPVAETLAQLWWVLFWGGTAVFLLVLALVLYATFRAPERRVRVHGTWLIVGGGLIFPLVVLTALLVYGTAAGQRILAPAERPLNIEVTGRQWWWEVRYPPDGDAPEVVTANELHLPVGVPVRIALESRDVIHSFWIPNLAGKVDMIPGRVNVLRLEASRPGAFLGQCAEFCGAQHAHMKFTVVAESPEDFAA
jgi:cytochrome c oxidase subunit II